MQHSQRKRARTMDTALEALFRDMLNNGWVTASNGEADSPTGYYGYMTNTGAEVESILDAFSETVEVYGVPTHEEIIGNFIVSYGSTGVIKIDKYNTRHAMSRAYLRLEARYENYVADDRRCEVFARCNNSATTSIPHPVLGEVYSCARCAEKLERLGQ